MRATRARFNLHFATMSFRRSLFLLLPCVFASPVFAQQLSDSAAPTKLSAPLPVAVAPEIAPLSPPKLRRSFPTLASPATPRVAKIELSRPPDTFGQTPAQLYPWLENVARAYPQQAKLCILGQSASGASIVAMEITPPNVSPWKLKRLVVICRQHSNEPEATGSGARLIYHWLRPRTAREKALSARTALLIVPIANPDGAARYQRRTLRGVDMNRDWGRNQSVEVRTLTRWIWSWKPQLIIDNHQWLPADRMPPPMAEASGGARARMAARTMSARSAQRGFALSARSRVGLDTLCHRFWGQRFGTPAVLLETRHQPAKAGARTKALEQAEAALWGAAESVK